MHPALERNRGSRHSVNAPRPITAAYLVYAKTEEEIAPVFFSLFFLSMCAKDCTSSAT